MTLPEWGLLLIAFGVFVWLYLSRSRALDRAEESDELWRELDRAVPVWSRSAVYDWAETGEFE